MTTERVGIIMNGVTGRMGRNQHLARSIAAIRADGGVEAGGTVIWPDPILVGRDLDRLRKLGEAHGIERFSTDLDACLADPEDQVYFDAQITSRREEAIAAAIDAGKAVYCEKPISTSSLGGLEIARRAEKAGVRNGAVQDKLFLPGLLKLGDVVASGELGRLLSVRLEFGYWVFEDDVGVGQRPSWNYRAEEGGGIVLDMFCHFRYLLDHLFGGVRSIMCTARTEVPRRVDERGKTYEVTAEDSAYALVELAGGALAQISASWCVRPYRDDLLVIHVDGTNGSATAGLRECRVQPATTTPVFVWNPDVAQETDPRGGWLEVPDHRPATNAFRRQWELFLRHVVLDEPFPWDLMGSVRGVQLAELAMLSNSERRWVEIPELPG
ncbi:MAG: Gfo/Idh/MocA family protein [Acidimicrobiales bacterium]|jgi:predicted dehydrogenase